MQRQLLEGPVVRIPNGVAVRMLPGTPRYSFWEKYHDTPWFVKNPVGDGSVGVKITRNVGRTQVDTIVSWRHIERFEEGELQAIEAAERPCGCGNPTRHKVQFASYLAKVL